MSISYQEERHGLPRNADTGWSVVVAEYAETPARMRFVTILTLRQMAGFSFSVIAAQIGVDRGSVHRLYKQAIQDFREWSGQPRFTDEELKAVLAGEAMPVLRFEAES